MDDVFQTLLQVCEKFLSHDATGHDFYHASRTFHLALHLQEKEGGDEYVIGAAAIMHDIMRPWEKETGKSHFGEEALQEIEKLLIQCNVDTSRIGAILDVIRQHDIYDWSAPGKNTIELQIVQDADNLEALGAIGIARCFMYGGAHSCPLWHPGEHLDFSHDFIEDGTNTSTVAHFYEKLFKLKDHMNTPTGKKMAIARHDFMQQFLDQLFDEWNGDK